MPQGRNQTYILISLVSGSFLQFIVQIQIKTTVFITIYLDMFRYIVPSSFTSTITNG